MPKKHDYWLRADGRIATARHSPINGKMPAELILMAETRRLLQLILTDPNTSICDDLRATITALLRSRARRTAPFMPLSAEQRLGWLDEVTEIVCKAPLEDCFTAGTTYRIQCEDVRIDHSIFRKSLHHAKEEVLITGNELLTTITDDLGHEHGFCHVDILAEPPIVKVHPLQTLVDHFEIPPVPDITKVYPATHKRNIEFLSKL
jgi:hypothetical protein